MGNSNSSQMSESSSEDEDGSDDVIVNGIVYKKSTRPGGRWNSDEHKRFIEALRMFGKDW